MSNTLVVTPDEAAKLLKLSNTTLNSLLANGVIPAYRDGANWKIPRTLLNAYVENRAIAEAKERRKINEEI